MRKSYDKSSLSLLFPGGESQIYDNNSNPLDKITFSDFLDSCYVNDTRVKHSVSEISSISTGYRDMLIIDFRTECDE